MEQVIDEQIVPVSVMIERRTWKRVRKHAVDRGKSASALVRQWIEAGLREEDRRSTVPPQS